MSELAIGSMILSAVLGLVQWFFQQTISDIKRENKDLRDKLDTIQKDYLHKDDFKEFKIELKAMFDELRKDIRALNEKT